MLWSLTVLVGFAASLVLCGPARHRLGVPGVMSSCFAISAGLLVLPALVSALWIVGTVGTLGPGFLAGPSPSASLWPGPAATTAMSVSAVIALLGAPALARLRSSRNTEAKAAADPATADR